MSRGASPWWRIGWRNLGRNRRRTAITASGLAFGYFAVVVLSGLTLGLVAEMITNGTGIVLGQLQVHAPSYLPERSLYETIGGDTPPPIDSLLATVAADPAVQAVSPRVYGTGLVSKADATSGAILVGIDPTRERAVTRLLETLSDDQMVRPGHRDVALGQDLARRLDVQPGDTIVLVAPAADGSLGNALFDVRGIVHSGLADVDGAYVLLPLGQLQDLLALSPDRIHEVVARVNDPWAAPLAVPRVQARLDSAGTAASAKAWTTLRPEIVDYARLSEASQWLMLVIVFAMAIFGIVNTLLMATVERRREFAVLLALGAAPSGIVRSVASEALALGIISLACGIVITAPVLLWLHVAPPNLSWLIGPITISGALIRPVLRVDYPWAMTAGAAVALLAMAVLAAMYPAWRAARVPPADALAGR